MSGSASLVLLLALSSAPEAEANEQVLSYKKGLLLQTLDGENQVKLNGRIQVRMVSEDTEIKSTVKRARIGLTGRTLGRRLGFKAEVDVGKLSFVPKDLYLDYRIIDGLKARFGHFKRPFSRQQITSSARQELVDRALTDKAFNAGRDVGLMIHNGYERSVDIEYAVAFLHDLNEARGAGLDLAVVARLGWNHGGLKGYSEADLEGGPLRVGLAVSGVAELTQETALGLELDAILKLYGFSASTAGYVSSAKLGLADEAGQRHLGGHVQFGMVLLRHVQPVLRHAWVSAEGQATEHELATGMSLFFLDHRLKLQTEIVSSVSSAKETEYMVRSQLQAAI